MSADTSRPSLVTTSAACASTMRYPMVRINPLLSITMAEPSRSRPMLLVVRPSGLMKVFTCTTPESSPVKAADWAFATEVEAGASSATTRAIRSPRAGIDLGRKRIRMNPLHQRKACKRERLQTEGPQTEELQTKDLRRDHMRVGTIRLRRVAGIGSHAPAHRILYGSSGRRLSAYAD